MPVSPVLLSPASLSSARFRFPLLDTPFVLGLATLPCLLTVEARAGEIVHADLAGVGTMIAAAGRETFAVFNAQLADAWRRAPALVVGLGAALVLPILALVALFVRVLVRASQRSALRRAPAVVETDGDGGAGIGSSSGDPATARTQREHLAWPAVGWITVDGAGETRRRIPRELMRIGRDADNELVLSDATVHRYHAVIQRTPESDFLIVDVSGEGGNGIKINGQRRERARLRTGDAIELGVVRLTFSAEPT